MAQQTLAQPTIQLSNESTSVPLQEFLLTVIGNNDKRYEQRFNDTKIAVDVALIAADKAVAAALAGQKEAVTKAEVAAEKRFESVNEFRNTLSDQQRNLMPRSEVEILIKGLFTRADSNENRIIAIEGKGQGNKDGIAYIIGLVGFLIGVITLIVRFLGI